MVSDTIWSGNSLLDSLWAIVSYTELYQAILRPQNLVVGKNDSFFLHTLLFLSSTLWSMSTTASTVFQYQSSRQKIVWTKWLEDWRGIWCNALDGAAYQWQWHVGGGSVHSCFYFGLSITSLHSRITMHGAPADSFSLHLRTATTKDQFNL